MYCLTTKAARFEVADIGINKRLILNIDLTRSSKSSMRYLRKPVSPSIFSALCAAMQSAENRWLGKMIGCQAAPTQAPKFLRLPSTLTKENKSKPFNIFQHSLWSHYCRVRLPVGLSRTLTRLLCVLLAAWSMSPMYDIDRHCIWPGTCMIMPWQCEFFVWKQAIHGYS